MPLVLKPRDGTPLPPFTFSPPSPSTSAQGDVPGQRDGVEDTPPKPPADFIPERDMWMFGAQPLVGTSEPGRGLVRCTRCNKIVMESAATEHKRICSHVLDGTPLTVKKALKGDKALKSTGPKKRRASELSVSDDSPTKKRVKLPGISPDDDDDDDAPSSMKGLKKSQIRKIQKEQAKLERKAAKDREKLEIAERKRLRATGPVDFDRQCGVINDKGLPCSRSLTCKTHTVGAKRAVQGRTRSYDDLFLEWQRAHNPNFKEPTTKKERDNLRKEKISATKRLDKDGSLKKKKGLGLLSGVDDDGVGDGEDGKREMEELVHVTKLAGERLCPRHPGSVWISVIGGGFAGLPQAQPSKNRFTNGPTARPSMTAGAGASGTAGSGANGGSSNGGGVGTGNGIWRAGNYEFAQVGDMLTKALAARPTANKGNPGINAGGAKAGQSAGPAGMTNRPLPQSVTAGMGGGMSKVPQPVSVATM